MSTAIAEQRVALADLLSLTKPGLTRLVVMTTGMGVWVAGGPYDLVQVVITILGTLLVVAAANTLNCYLERDVDGLMARTANRPLPCGRMEPGVALWMGLGLAAVSIPLLTFAVRPLVGLLAAIALVSYVLIYTPLKRVTSLSTLVGAVPGAIPPVIGWVAVTGRIDPPAVILFGILFLWQLPHFFAIALFRKDEYERAGFRVLSVEHGDHATWVQMVRYSFALLPVSLLLVPTGAAGGLYLALAGSLGVAQLVVMLRGLFRPSAAWARRAFHFTLLYMTGLMFALVVDGLI